MAAGRAVWFSCPFSHASANRGGTAKQTALRKHRLRLRVCGQWCSKWCSLLSEHLGAPVVHREALPFSRLCHLWKRWDEGVSLSWPLILLCCYWVWNVGCRSWVEFQCKCIPIYFSSWMYLVSLLFSLSERAEGAAVCSWADGSFCPRDRSMAEHGDSYIYRSDWVQTAV